MEIELDALIKMQCWNVVNKKDLPPGTEVLPSTWAYKIKRKPSGEFVKFKARFVARGDKQIEGIHYTDKYSPVVPWRTARMMLVLAIHEGLYTKQIDFSNAFVQADLKEEVYLNMPPGGFSPQGHNPKDLVLKLN